MELSKNLVLFVKTTKSFIKNNITGRGAISTMDLLMITAALYECKDLPNTDEYAFVEIGTLFGVSTIAIRKIMNEIGLTNHKLITIDPLEGYYDKGKDPVTGYIPSLEILQNNISICNVTKDSIVILKNYSTDTEVEDTLDKYNVYGSFIDGDHTYDGVKKDWELLKDRTIDTGFVAFHDYLARSGEYGVTTFVDKELRNDTYREHLPVKNAHTFILFK